MTEPGAPPNGSAAGSLVDRLRSTAVVDVVPRVSVLVAVPAATGAGAAVAGLAVAVVLVVPGLHRRWWLWATIAAARLPLLVPDWHGVDNHEFLITYWCAALAVAFGTGGTDPVQAGEAVAAQARFLLVIVFGAAVVWKLATGEFADGSFFHHLFLTDDRVERAGRWLSGLTPEEFDLARARVASIRGLEPGDRVTVDAGRLAAVTPVLAVATLLVEGAVACCFAAPPARWPGRWRHGALLTFAAATYSLVPVGRFGVTLLTMGYATTRASGSRPARRSYLTALVLLVAYGASPVR